MENLDVPSRQVIQMLVAESTKAMKDRLFYDQEEKKYSTRVCAMCDCMATVDNPMVGMGLDHFVRICHKSGASKDAVLLRYPATAVVQGEKCNRLKASAMVMSYTANHASLAPFVLSPSTRVYRDKEEQEIVEVCSRCKEDCPSVNTPINVMKSPKRSLWNGNCIGAAPKALLDLNMAELAMVSPNRIDLQAAVFYADGHRGVYGWHAMYENKVRDNLETLEQLVDAGLNGKIVVVLCGPFDSTQRALVQREYTVEPDKVKAAFKWLHEWNHYFSDYRLPDGFQFRQPIIIEDRKT